MFKKGNAVLHPGHGAGLVVGIKTMTVGGNERRYYHVDLMDGDRSLLIPVEEAEAVGLRLVADAAPILDVLRSAPAELTKDYRSRQARLSKKIYSGDLEKVAEAFRDLAWRKHTVQFSIKDSVLLEKAERLLASVFASRRSDRDFDKARSRLSSILLQNFQQREATGATPG